MFSPGTEGSKISAFMTHDTILGVERSFMSKKKVDVRRQKKGK